VIFYMLRDKTTGAWYKRSHGRSLLTNWVEQQEASVWTSAAGPTACLGSITRSNARVARLHTRVGLKCPVVREPEIVSFQAGSPKSLAWVHCDDWEGLYVNGKLIREGHGIEIDDIPTDVLGVEIESIYPNDDWLKDGGRMPENLDEVPR
jgi:hypothetical protein